MKERTQINKLVVAILTSEKRPVSARELYEELKTEQPHVLRQESVLCFKSFCRLVPTMDIKPVGSGIKKYVKA